MTYTVNKKSYLRYTIPFILGILCFITYSIIGYKLAPDGTLVEPFFLIPVGELFILIGIIIIMITRIIKLFKKILRQKPKNFK